MTEQKFNTDEARKLEEQRLDESRKAYLKTQQNKMIVVLIVGVILSTIATMQF